MTVVRHKKAYQKPTRSSAKPNRLKRYEAPCVLVVGPEGASKSVVGPLQKKHFDVQLARTCLEAVRKVSADDIDVIVCDLELPSFPIEMLHAAVKRANPQLLNRFIFLTPAKLDRNTGAFIRRIGGTKLAKPFERQELVGAIERVLERAESASSRR